MKKLIIGTLLAVMGCFSVSLGFAHEDCQERGTLSSQINEQELIKITNRVKMIEYVDKKLASLENEPVGYVYNVSDIRKQDGTARLHYSWSIPINEITVSRKYTYYSEEKGFVEDEMILGEQVVRILFLQEVRRHVRFGEGYLKHVFDAKKSDRETIQNELDTQIENLKEYREAIDNVSATASWNLILMRDLIDFVFNHSDSKEAFNDQGGYRFKREDEWGRAYSIDDARYGSLPQKVKIGWKGVSIKRALYQLAMMHGYYAFDYYEIFQCFKILQKGKGEVDKLVNDRIEIMIHERKVNNVKKAVKYILSEDVLDLERLKEAHKMVLDGLQYNLAVADRYFIVPGKLRMSGETRVENRQIYPSKEVQERILALIQKAMNASTESAIAEGRVIGKKEQGASEYYKDPLTAQYRWVAEQYAEFQKIHPFRDGNGRLGHVFLCFLLKRLNLPLISVSINDVSGRVGYSESTQNIIETGDGRSFVEFLKNYAVKENFMEAEEELFVAA